MKIKGVSNDPEQTEANENDLREMIKEVVCSPELLASDEHGTCSDSVGTLADFSQRYLP
ncbi:MAG TPA: hypothetical protein PLY52_10175 [Methanothrix sp.]|uniref:hypothetical protein n=1 Tax=Methanothrix sp. TaxID=90426 RepID=UPI002C0F4E81|nr:hypothetical protein [Euryarchaeota archaeon]HON36658.1 hypothetical protein [Methanothrix sp.]HRU76442.1 hypothetical protein [Methanothrix sp.]